MKEAYFSTEAKQQFRKLDKPVKRLICRKIKEYRAVNSVLAYSAKGLVGGGYRLRAGDWRIVFDIDERNGKTIMTVIRIGNRRDVYR